jgi:hypothetical protein
VIRGVEMFPSSAKYDGLDVQMFAWRSPMDVGAAEALMQVQCVETRGSVVLFVCLSAYAMTDACDDIFIWFKIHQQQISGATLVF